MYLWSTFTGEFKTTPDETQYDQVVYLYYKVSIYYQNANQNSLNELVTFTRNSLVKERVLRQMW